MKNILIIALMAVSATCQRQEAVKMELPLKEINATIVGNKLLVDGCDAYLWLNFAGTSSDSGTYMRLPTDATRLLMDTVIKAELAKQPTGTLWMGSKNVTIRYRETEQTAILLCGWNAKQTLRAIELLEVRER